MTPSTSQNSELQRAETRRDFADFIIEIWQQFLSYLRVFSMWARVSSTLACFWGRKVMDSMRYAARFSIIMSGIMVVLAFAAPTLAQTETKRFKPLTVEAIYGQPGLSGRLAEGVRWSPDGKQVAFLESVGSGKGTQRELAMIDVASGKRSVLISAGTLASVIPPQPFPIRQRTGAARRPPGPFEFSPDGSALMFRGQTSVVWLDLKSQKATTLISGSAMLSDEKISPDGRWVSFLRDYNLWIVSTSGGEAQPVTTGGSEALRKGQLDWVYPEELEIRSGYWWAPDSSAIAYLEMDEHAVTQFLIQNNIENLLENEIERYPRAGEANPVVRVLVQPISGGDPRVMDIGADQEILIPRVQWLPDSKHLAIQRLTRVGNNLELTIVDAATGVARIVLSEKDKTWVDVTDILWFSKDGREFIWGSERTGYRHLYLYKIDGSEVAQLTRGEWEVETLDAVDESRGLVYFTATERSPLERQLYRVSMDGSGFTRISREAGTHSANFSPDASAFVDTHSDAMTPTRQDLMRGDGTEITAINEVKSDLASYGLSPVEFLTVTAKDGTALNASMIKPPDFSPGKKYPVIVYTYGGPSQVVRNLWLGGTFLFNQLLAQKGFIIFSVDNHGSMGRGRDFARALYHDASVHELSDQRDGVVYLRKLPFVDGERIGIWGWSYGGHMTLHALFEAPQDFKVGFAGAPVADWLQYDSIATERFLGLPKDDREGYRQASPINFVNGLQGKLMIGQGTGDDNVHLINTTLILDQAIKDGKDIEVVLLPGRGHPANDAAGRIYLMNRVLAFFLKNL
jgi:dipeptidyl-peptidase 4